MIRKKAACDLGLMTEILRSDRTKEEKIDLLQRMEFLPPPSFGGTSMFLPLITQFQASEQLEERIGQLVKETGVEPRAIEDIPDEHPLERAMRLRKEACMHVGSWAFRPTFLKSAPARMQERRTAR
jgi:hypothetical protein